MSNKLAKRVMIAENVARERERESKKVDTVTELDTGEQVRRRTT